MAYDLFAATGLPVWCRIILSAIIIFIFVAFIVELLWKWKATRRLVA